MPCPNCGGKSRVFDVRQVEFAGKQITYRRRECKECGKQWRTHELNVLDWDANEYRDLADDVLYTELAPLRREAK